MGFQPLYLHILFTVASQCCAILALGRHVREFLRGVCSLFELHVYTMGARAYAAEMVGLLDPSGEFGLKGADRVIGKEDSTATHTKDLDVILGSERTTLVIDDSAAVWPQHAAQLLIPRRWLHGPCYCMSLLLMLHLSLLPPLCASAGITSSPRLQCETTRLQQVTSHIY
jgi:TFIIF-interacting CTD phosphatase-like protein